MENKQNISDIHTNFKKKVSEFLDKKPSFEFTKPGLSPPLEITRSQLRLMNMVDENFEIHDDVEIYQDTE